LANLIAIMREFDMDPGSMVAKYSYDTAMFTSANLPIVCRLPTAFWKNLKFVHFFYKYLMV